MKMKKYTRFKFRQIDKIYVCCFTHNKEMTNFKISFFLTFTFYIYKFNNKLFPI